MIRVNFSFRDEIAEIYSEEKFREINFCLQNSETLILMAVFFFNFRIADTLGTSGVEKTQQYNVMANVSRLLSSKNHLDVDC